MRGGEKKCPQDNLSGKERGIVRGAISY